MAKREPGWKPRLESIESARCVLLRRMATAPVNVLRELQGRVDHSFLKRTKSTNSEDTSCKHGGLLSSPSQLTPELHDAAAQPAHQNAPEQRDARYNVPELRDSRSQWPAPELRGFPAQRDAFGPHADLPAQCNASQRLTGAVGEKNDSSDLGANPVNGQTTTCGEQQQHSWDSTGRKNDQLEAGVELHGFLELGSNQKGQLGASRGRQKYSAYLKSEADADSQRDWRDMPKGYSAPQRCDSCSIASKDRQTVAQKEPCNSAGPNLAAGYARTALAPRRNMDAAKQARKVLQGSRKKHAAGKTSKREYQQVSGWKNSAPQKLCLSKQRAAQPVRANKVHVVRNARIRLRKELPKSKATLEKLAKPKCISMPKKRVLTKKATSKDKALPKKATPKDKVPPKYQARSKSKTAQKIKTLGKLKATKKAKPRSKYKAAHKIKTLGKLKAKALLKSKAAQKHVLSKYKAAPKSKAASLNRKKSAKAWFKRKKSPAKKTVASKRSKAASSCWKSEYATKK